MQPLYTDEEFKSAKSRQLLPLKCLHCTQTFHRTKHVIQMGINPQHENTCSFCSRRCLRLHYHTPPAICHCEWCQTSFTKNISRHKKTKHHFCCQSCSAKYNNAHKTKGTRISKLEVWLASKLPTLYPNLEFHFNRKDAINGELDIFIPSLKLAFELNGIFHYEPIFGPEKLTSIQNNDMRKSQACLEQGIELCLIDVSSLSYFKEQKAVKFLTIIQNIINLKLSESSPIISDCLVSTT